MADAVVIQIPEGHRIAEVVAGVWKAAPYIKCECNPLMRFGGGKTTTLPEAAELYAIHIANVIREARLSKSVSTPPDGSA